MANSLTANTHENVGNAQFQGLYSQMWKVNATVVQDTAVAISVTAVVSMTVPGVALGDHVVAASINLDWSDGTDVAVLAWAVTAANTVSLHIHAPAGELALNSLNTTAKVLIGRPAW